MVITNEQRKNIIDQQIANSSLHTETQMALSYKLCLSLTKTLISSRVTTDRASARETCFQLAALSLHVENAIEDKARQEHLLGFFSGTQTGE